MDESVFCACDQAAYDRGDPFCGFCGRRAGSPWLHVSAEPLPLNLPLRVSEKQQRATPFLTLNLRQHVAAPGIVDSARFIDSHGQLALTNLELVFQQRSFKLDFKVTGSAFTFSLPDEFATSGLPALATLRCSFNVAGPRQCRPYIFALQLQPEGLFTMSSGDTRFEDQAALIPGRDRYALWQFEDLDTPIELVVTSEFRAGLKTLPDFSTVRVGSPNGPLRVLAGTVETTPGKFAQVVLQPAAIRRALAPSQEGMLALTLHSRHGDASALLDLRIHSRRAPTLYLDPPVIFQIDFKAHKKGWLTKGCDDLKNILNFEDDVRLWKPQFEVTVAPDSALDEAALFSARIDAGYLTITARLKPEWLNTVKVSPLEGSAKLLLSNANNFSQRRDTIPPETVRPLAEVKIVVDWDKRGSVPVLAIDFGTTNTCAAVISSYNDVTPREVEIQGETDSNVPTLLFYNLHKNDAGQEEIASVVFGKRALSEGRRVISSTCFKKGIKTDLLNQKQRPIPIGEKLSLIAKELTTDYLTPFINGAMLSPEIDGRPVEKLVFTFPVAASPLYSKMLGDAIAASVAKLHLPIKRENVVKSCDEASAGGIWWFCKKKIETQLPGKVSLLVFDYGGGTTDLSVLEFSRSSEKWQVTIKGIAGLSPCGGEDLTWRMAREFVACSTREMQRSEPHNREQPALQPIRPDSMLGKNLASTAELFGRDEWQKKPYTRFLLEVIEERKIASVGGEQLEILPKAVFHDLLENAESMFVPSTVEFRSDSLALADSSSLGGSVAMCKFSEYKQQLVEYVAATAPGEGMLEGHVWLFKVQEKLLEEPERAIEVAGNLITHLYGNGKVDCLLLIGQASKTRAVQALIRSRLAGKFGEIAAEGMQKPKSCVALGACDFYMQRDDWDFRPTLLHRIIYLDGMTFKQILRSDTERNAVVMLNDGDLLRRPGGKLTVLVDCSYANRGEEGLRQEMEQVGANGFERVDAGKHVSVVVADPIETASYLKLDARIRAIVDEIDRGNSTNYWYFLAWIEDDLSHAWTFRYHL